MEAKKEDLRVIKTKNLIKNSFIDLIGLVGYQRITIKNLCEHAMINRNTFYLHYTDKDDLIKSMVNEVVEKYQEKFTPLAANFYIAVTLRDTETFTENIKVLLQIISEDIELLRIILIDEYLTGYFKSFERTYERLIINYLKIKNQNSKLIIKYIMSGVGGILAEWIIKDSASIEATSKIISQLVFDNIMFFVKENRK